FGWHMAAIPVMPVAEMPVVIAVMGMPVRIPEAAGIVETGLIDAAAVAVVIGGIAIVAVGDVVIVAHSHMNRRRNPRGVVAVVIGRGAGRKRQGAEGEADEDGLSHGECSLPQSVQALPAGAILMSQKPDAGSPSVSRYTALTESKLRLPFMWGSTDRA